MENSKVKISAVIIGSINIDVDTLKKIEGIELFKVTDRKSCEEIVNRVSSDDLVFIISDGREVYYAEKFFSRLPALKIFLVTEAQAAANKNLRDVIIQLPAQNFNEKIFEVANAFNDVLNVEGIVPLDLADIQSLFKNSGKAISNIGVATGENAAENAVQNVLEGHDDIKSARSILMNFKGSNKSVSIDNIKAATKKIKSSVREDAKFTFGITIDESFGDKVKVAVIAGRFLG